MIGTAVTLKANPRHRERVLALVRAVADATRAREPGCEMFLVAEGGDDPDTLVVVETFADQAAYDAHWRQEHLLAFRAGVAALPPDAIAERRSIPIRSARLRGDDLAPRGDAP